MINLYLINLIRHLYPSYDSVVSSKLIDKENKHNCMTSTQMARVKTKVNLSKTDLPSRILVVIRHGLSCLLGRNPFPFPQTESGFTRFRSLLFLFGREQLYLPQTRQITCILYDIRNIHLILRFYAVFMCLSSISKILPFRRILLNLPYARVNIRHYTVTFFIKFITQVFKIFDDK